MAISIQQIKELREATAAGMGACKEALTATNGNMDEAVKYLREKGLAVAAKRVDKESKQGIVALAEAADKKSMALAEVNCETDFVAKTEAFIKFTAPRFMYFPHNWRRVSPFTEPNKSRRAKVLSTSYIFISLSAISIGRIYNKVKHLHY